MKYNLKKVTKTMILEAGKQFSGLELPKLKDCEFKSYRNSAWLYFSGYSIYMDVCLGTAFLRVRGLGLDYVKELPLDWLRDNNMLREVS